MVCKALALLLVAFAVGSAVGARPFEELSHSTRRLLDIDVNTTTTPFSLSAFGTGNAAGGNCYLQGYPGSRADQTLAGPLKVTVPVGGSLTISFNRGSDSYFANYNYSGNVDDITLNQNSSFGLISVTFKAAAAGQSATVLSGLISGSNPITQPVCLVGIVFTAVAPTPPPPPPPTPTPPPNSACNGVVPCYCQNGYCFNNGATLSNTCKPPSGQSCTPVSVNASAIGIQYAYGYTSPVNVCKCSSSTSG